ncbi:MAG: dimethylsulfoniopropionate demethylase [Chloroflexota bacterium]
MVAPLQIGIIQRTRKSPFFDATIEWGVQGFTVYNHMLFPTFYESFEADYWKLINSVACWDVACERQVEITGPDASKLAQLLTPRNLSKCRIGQGKYVPIVADDGGMINDPILLRLGENHYWLSLADSDVLLWARGVAYGKGFDVTIIEPDVSPLAIQGPNAENVTADLLGDWVRDIKYFWFREFELDGIPLVVARSGWSKQGGFELYLRDGQYGVELWNRVMEAGKPYDIGPGTPSTIERIESGLLSYGNDMHLENNPFEIGLGKYCDLKMEADFIGKAALRRIKAEGIKQKMVGVVIDGPKKPGSANHWPLYHRDQCVGAVTSATHSPRLKQNIALAMVEIEHTETGTQLTVESNLGRETATVASIPFI